MSYKPFKMLGHEHPGIKQKSPVEMSMEKTYINDEMVDGVSTTPGKFAQAVQAVTRQGGVSKAGTPGGMSVAPHGDEAHTGGGGDGAPPSMRELAGLGNTAAENATGAMEAVAPEEAPFEAMGKEEWRGMNRMGQMKHLSGLNKEQKIQQLKAGGGFGGFGGSGFGGGFGGGMFSDIRLKEKIQKTGKSPSGIPTYEFNYIGDNNRYSGVMAQDLIEMNIDAVSMDNSGFYKVNYNNIDVDMHLIKN